MNKIKYMNIILTVILIILFLFSFLMVSLMVPLVDLNNNLKDLRASNDTIIILQKKLEVTTLELKEQIELFNSKFIKKKKQPVDISDEK